MSVYNPFRETRKDRKSAAFPPVNKRGGSSPTVRRMCRGGGVSAARTGALCALSGGRRENLRRDMPDA